MATYIKGVTDVLPGPTAMAPDYKLLGTALATLQNKYDKGFDQVKSMYSSMINRALSSSDNEKFRQDFLKKADAELSKLSGIDLSNPNNVTQANSIFKPLVNDKQYVKDLYLTESQDNEISKMEQTKTSSDSKVRATYDPKMEKWLYLGKKRLTEMKRDDGSIDNASYNKFAPWEDPIDYGMAKAKEQGLEIGRTEFEGMFLRHIVGGDQAVGPYKNWFKTVIGDKFDNQFRIEAELDYEDQVSSLMAKDKNLDRQTATQQLAQDFSGRYVKLMNNEINDTQTRIEEIDSKIRAAKRSYPKGLPADKVKIFQNLAQQKIQLEDQVQKLNKEKGTDQEFQQKAVNLFINNPAGTYVNQIKDNYATEFGIAKATTKTDETYEVNQAALQKDRQKFEWGMMMKKADIDLAHDKEMARINQNNAIELAAMKGELSTQASGATFGNATDAGSYTLDYAYSKSIQNNLNTAISGYVDDKVLAVAANLNYTNAGISTGANDGLNMAAVKQAIINRGNGQALTADQTAALTAYLRKVKPGFNFDPSKHSFADIQTLISYGFGANQRNYANTNVAKAGLGVLDRAGKAMNSYTSQFNDEQSNLQAMYQNQTMRPYITQSNGLYTINYAALNKLNQKDKNMYLDYLIPHSDVYKKSAAVQARTIELHPKDPSKMDPSIYRNIIENALAIGVGNTAFTEEQTAKLREIARGDENLKNLFDTGVKYELVIVDNKEMFRVKVPVKKSLTGDKPKSMATQFGIDDEKGSIAASNYVDFLVDASAVNNIGGNDLVMINPTTKQTQVYENDLKNLLSQSINAIDVPRSASWVTTNGFGDPNKGVSAFPSYLADRVPGGQISRAGDEIIIDILKFDNTVQHINYTEANGVTYSQYKQNPALYDKVLSDYIEQISTDYAYGNINAAEVKHQVNNNRNDLVPWDKALKP